MSNGKPAAKLQFHYIKSPDYREFGCHGVIGGETPNQKIWMSLFAERPPLPRLVEFDVHPSATGAIEFDETKNTPSRIDTRSGVIRHVETTAYLDLDTARRIHAWLGDRILQLEKAEKKK
jgi:hypothetical protein